MLNSYSINSRVLNGDLTSGANETLISIEKTIELRTTGSGTLANIEKQIRATATSSPLIYIEKRILNVAATNTFYIRNGWEPIITLGGLTVSTDELCGEILIIKLEEDNHTAQFSLILYPDIYYLYDYQGVDVTISVYESGTITRLFTGIVDIPEVNAIEEKLTLNCVSDRRSLLANLYTLEPYIGFYSSEILGSNEGTFEKINARLSTIPYSLDFDSYNNYSLTSWTPASNANFTYGSSDVYRKDPTLKIESSAKILNKVNITMSYGYQRAHHRQVAYVWIHPYGPTNPATGLGGICPFLESRPSMPTRDLIRSAINSAGWPVRGSIYFGKQFLSGNYQCDGVWTSWSTVESSYLNAPIVDSSGNAVNDASGNPLYRSVQTTQTDNTNLYTMYSSWNATTRFLQNIKEEYTVTVSASTSQSIYGVLETTETYGITDSNDYAGWENYQAYTTAPTGVTIVPSSSAESYFFNGDSDRSTFNIAYVCALNKAKTTILKTHRDTTINFQRPLTPNIELKHTVSLTGKWIRGKGKCIGIRHVMCISDGTSGVAGEAYSDITLAQYRGVGSTSNSALTYPAGFSDTPSLDQPAIALDTHLGVDPNTAGSQNWTGYVGNIGIREFVPAIGLYPGGYNYTRTNYQESFIINTPPIQPEFRNTRNLITSASYSVNIPNDSTEYESYG